MTRFFLISLLFMLISFFAQAGEKVLVSQWLLTPPLEVNYPAYHQTPNVQGEPFSDRQLLTFDHMDLKDYYPEAGKRLDWLYGHSVAWSAEMTDSEGLISISGSAAGERPEVAYLAVYIRTERWMQAQLELKSPWMLEAWLNGHKIGTKSTMEGLASENEQNDNEGRAMPNHSHGSGHEGGSAIQSGEVSWESPGKASGKKVPRQVRGEASGKTPGEASKEEPGEVPVEVSLKASGEVTRKVSGEVPGHFPGAEAVADGYEDGRPNGEPNGEEDVEMDGDGHDEKERKPHGRISHPLELSQGTHLLVIKTLRPPLEGAEWEVGASLEVKEPFLPSDFSLTTSPETIKDILHFMDGQKLSSVRPSADGSLAAYSYRRSLPPSDRSESWTEIRRLSDDKLIHSFRHASIARLDWLPATNALSYTSTRDGLTTLYLHHMETGEKRILMEDARDFGGFRWSPDESYILYSIREEGSGTDVTMRQILGMQDRQGHFRHRSFLYKLDIASGVRTRLTHGNITTSIQDISPDGCCFIFSQMRPDYLERPFSKTDYFMMNLATLTVDTLLADQNWHVSLRFSPVGTDLLATGAPSAFDGAGENIPEGMIANASDTQAYIFSPTEGSVKAITYDFDPAVSSVHWHAPDQHIYMLVNEEDFRHLYRYNVRRERFERIDTGTDYISDIRFASQGQVATYMGHKTNAPPKAFQLNLRNDRYTVLEEPDAERYRHVQFGEVYDWDFTASTGVEVTGRVYLPPGFDADRNYPVIVYQYGGITPVGRTFGHRYPFNLWAGNGYVVYVIQPSGAIGYGQEFSAAHVNNWGITVVDEIVEGTEQFLAAHPFADASRVGLAGASYGGFMTMLVLSHTDIFATGISHAGISNIASYWGDGYWGYIYSASATAYSFPWNRREIYVDQSPLFRADHINTPLLLVTGDGDTNVPPGESVQMYTALKLLDREVELILVEGEDHHILTYNKRLQWHDTIMAWWDKYLKDQPEWWDRQYPARNY